MGLALAVMTGNLAARVPVGQSSDNFGCQTRAVDSAAAAKLCGIQEPGLEVVGVRSESLANEMGLRVSDVLFKVNGDLSERDGDIEAWLGCSAWGRQDVTQNARVVISNRFPIGTKLERGTSLYTVPASGRLWLLSSDTVVETASIVAGIVQNDYQHVYALANTYGKGRVYWQGDAQLVNFPKVGDLFIAGVKWASGK